MYAQNFTNRPPAFYAALLAVTLVPLYFASYRYRLWFPYGGTDSGALVQASSDFVQDWLEVHVIQPFNPSALSSYCNRTDWRPNLVFNLADGAEGGIAELRGNVLDFLFYAIEAGASIVLPSMAGKSRANASIIATDTTSFGMLFDEAWFLHTMEQACPQMAIYKPENGHKMADALPGTYVPRSRRTDVDQGNTKKAYLEHLDALLKERAEFKPDELTLVDVERTLWQVDTRSLPQGLRRNFGQVLQTAPEVRRLAAVVVQELATKHSYTHINPRLATPKHAFYGAQLSTGTASEDAASSEPYFNFSAQANVHLEQAIKHKLKLTYIASDNATEPALFGARASTQAPLLVAVSKFDLLQPVEVAALKQLTAIQQAFVDYEVLKRCSVFGGAVKSSSSYNIALTRNQWLADQGKMNDPWFVIHEDVGVAFDDGFSRIFGRDGVYEQQIPRGMWP